MQKNGGIYRLPSGYNILTYAANPELLSDNKPETVLRASEQGGEELYPFAFNLDYSSQMAARCAIDYVDAAQETCNFECDSFYAQLALLRQHWTRCRKTLMLLISAMVFCITTSFYPRTALSISRDATCIRS